METVLEGYTCLCDRADLPARGKKTFTLNGTRVLIITCDDQLYAIEDIHPRGWRSLAHGAVIGSTITSPNNGARYDLRTGAYLGGGVVPLGHDHLRVLKAQVVDGHLYVHL